MVSRITSKFQVTIPKGVRDELRLSPSDSLEWKIADGRLVVERATKPFLRWRGALQVGRGDIGMDIQRARRQRARELARR